MTDSAAGAAIPPGWPRMSLGEVEALLTAPGQRFEMETIEIRGVPTRVWKHAPLSLAALVYHSRSHGERLMTIYEEERISY
jgi:long-chain acyl-CoA synthetase